MALFYTGYRPILRGQSDSDWVNTYTGKVGIYSNWSLMSRHQALEGAPQANHVPGTGIHPHDIFLSRRFTGLDTKNIMDNAGIHPRPYEGMGRDGSYGPGLDSGFGDRDNPVASGFFGRFHPWQYHGIATMAVFANTEVPFGHVAFRDVPYAFFVNWFFHGLDVDKAINNPGHAIRPIAVGFDPDNSYGPGIDVFGNIKDDGTHPAASFGYFNPYTFKGVISAKEVNNPGQVSTSGIYPNAFLDRDHLGGHNRVNEWIGIPAANALGTGAGRHHRGNH